VRVVVVAVDIAAVADVALQPVHTARFMRARRPVSSVFSTPKMESSDAGVFLCPATKRADWTNMPPEPAPRSERLGSGSEVERFRAQFRERLLVVGFAAGETPELRDQLANIVAHCWRDIVVPSRLRHQAQPAGPQQNRMNPGTIRSGN